MARHGMMRRFGVLCATVCVCALAGVAGIFDGLIPGGAKPARNDFLVTSTINGVETIEGTAPATFTFTVPAYLEQRTVLGTTLPAESFSNFRWDFNGDGTIDTVTAQNTVNWTFTEAMPSTAMTVYAKGSVNGEVYKYHTIRVLQNTAAPTNAVLAVTPVTGDAPLTVTCTLTAQSETAFTHYFWDLDGDGIAEQTTTSPSVTVTYLTPDTAVTVFGIVKNAAGLTAKSNAVTVTTGSTVKLGGAIVSPTPNATVAGSSIPLAAQGTTGTTAASFSYRATGGAQWISLGDGTASANMFRASWNVAGLTKGTYELMASFRGGEDTIPGNSPVIQVTLVADGTDADYSYSTTGLGSTMTVPVGGNPMQIPLFAGTLKVPANSFPSPTSLIISELSGNGLNQRGLRQRERVATGLAGVSLSTENDVELNAALSLSFDIPSGDTALPSSRLAVFSQQVDGTWLEMTSTVSADGTAIATVVTTTGTYVLAETEGDEVISLSTADGKTTYTQGELIHFTYSVGIREKVELVYLGIMAPPEVGTMFITISKNAPYLAVNEYLTFIETGAEITPIDNATLFTLPTGELWTGVYTSVMYIIRADGTGTLKMLPITVTAP